MYIYIQVNVLYTWTSHSYAEMLAVANKKANYKP